jgi:tetratricopeptide (TPR) repeat protein
MPIAAVTGGEAVFEAILVLSFWAAVGYGIYWYFFKTPGKPASLIKLETEMQAELEELQRPRASNNPPTADETKNAHNLLRVSNARYEEAFKAKDGEAQLTILTQATRDLLRARKIDPSVKLTTTHDGKAVTETMDEVAAKYVYLESLLHFQRGEAQNEAQNKWLEEHLALRYDQKKGDIKDGFKVFEEARKKHYGAAVKPGERAVTYCPNNTLYLRHLSQVYSRVGNNKAQEMISRALAIDPDDIETLKISTAMQ